MKLVWEEGKYNNHVMRLRPGLTLNVNWSTTTHGGFICYVLGLKLKHKYDDLDIAKKKCEEYAKQLIENMYKDIQEL